MTEDCKTSFQLDASKILDFIVAKGGECSVEDLKLRSGAESLRIYPLIYRLSHSHNLRITSYDSWGAPLSVCVLNTVVSD